MARARLDWIDAARGFALALVVLQHASGRSASRGLATTPLLNDANLVLDGFRMPTLVMISGLLAAGASAWSWPDVFRRRTGPLLLMYVIWSVIAVSAVAILVGHAFTSDDAARLALLPVRPEAKLWYLYSLALYYLGARALRRVPTAVLLPIAVGVNLFAVATWHGNPDPVSGWWWQYVGEHWVFFVAAERLARWYWRASRATSARVAALAIGGFAALGALAVATGVVTDPVVMLVLAAAGTAVALLSFPVWGDRAWLSWARAIGRHSLGVYVMQLATVEVIVFYLVPRMPSFRGAGVIVPFAITVVTLAVTYAATRAIERWLPVPLLRPWWSTAERKVESVPQAQ